MIENEYAGAIFMLGEEEHTLEIIKSDIECAGRILSDNHDYIKLLDTPSLTQKVKISLIDEAFSPLCQSVLNLLKILCQKHMVYAFSDIAKEFFALYNKKMNIESVEAITAIPMSEGQLNSMKMRLEELTQKNILIKNTVDKSIIGGVRLRYMGKQIDSSIRTRLESFQESLKKTII